MYISAVLTPLLIVPLLLLGCAARQRPQPALVHCDAQHSPLVTGELLLPEDAPSTIPAAPLEVVTGHEIARSLQNRPIVFRQYRGVALADAPSVEILLFAGIHGNEPTTVFAAARLIELLDTDVASIIPPGHRLTVVPVANPDGYAARRRQNSAGIDLNRNFPAANFSSAARNKKNSPGPSPLSEPESRAIHDLVLSLKPTRILTLHSIRPPRHGNNYDGPAQQLAELLATKNGYAVLPTIGYPTPGSFGSWAGIDLKIPTITLEFPSNATGPAAWVANREAILAFIRGS